MNDFYSPMLAKKFEDYEKRGYVGFVQPKLDGMRCTRSDRALFSRTGKRIESIPKLKVEIDRVFDGMAPDGELFCRGVDFEDIMSSVRRTVNIEEDERVEYWVYDVKMNAPFKQRIEAVTDRCARTIGTTRNTTRIRVVETHRVETHAQIMYWFNKWIKEGYEGLMFRSTDVWYEMDKRSPSLLKLKPWHDVEAVVVGLIEGLGKHEGRLGALDCLFKGKDNAETRVKVGTGFDDLTRQLVWDNQDTYLGKDVTIKYQNMTKYGIPRFPVFQRFREEE